MTKIVPHQQVVTTSKTLHYPINERHGSISITLGICLLVAWIMKPVRSAHNRRKKGDKIPPPASREVCCNTLPWRLGSASTILANDTMQHRRKLRWPPIRSGQY